MKTAIVEAVKVLARRAPLAETPAAVLQHAQAVLSLVNAYTMLVDAELRVQDREPGAGNHPSVPRRPTPGGHGL